MDRMAYAGWNTDGNTLGTVIANTVLLTLYRGRLADPSRTNGAFNVMRMVEDIQYQVGVRVLWLSLLTGAVLC